MPHAGTGVHPSNEPSTWVIAEKPAHQQNAFSFCLFFTKQQSQWQKPTSRPGTKKFFRVISASPDAQRNTVVIRQIPLWLVDRSPCANSWQGISTCGRVPGAKSGIRRFHWPMITTTGWVSCTWHPSSWLNWQNFLLIWDELINGDCKFMGNRRCCDARKAPWFNYIVLLHISCRRTKRKEENS